MAKMVYDMRDPIKDVWIYCDRDNIRKVRKIIRSTIPADILNTDTINFTYVSSLVNYVLVLVPEGEAYPDLDYDFTYGFDDEDILPGSDQNGSKCYLFKRYDALEAKRAKVETSLMAKFDLTPKQVKAIHKYRLGKLVNSNIHELRIAELEDRLAKITSICRE
jgi:hypothetical protein